MTRTPTAEEVLGLYLDWQETEDRFDEFDMRSKFFEALKDWQAVQGPVTCEWFEERFGRCAICKNACIYSPNDDGTISVTCEDAYGEVTITITNPTRERIEALVEMLGGSETQDGT